MHDSATPSPDSIKHHQHKTIQRCTVPALNTTTHHHDPTIPHLITMSPHITTQKHDHTIPTQFFTSSNCYTNSQQYYTKTKQYKPHQSITKHYKTKTLQHTTIPKLFNNTKTEPYTALPTPHITPLYPHKNITQT